MQDATAIEKLHDTGLDRRRSIVWKYDGRDDHVAAVVEGDRQRGLARRIAGSECIGAATALHRADRDRAAGAERRRLAADKVEVAHAIEVSIFRNAGRAIAGAELGAQVELDLGAAIGGLAVKGAAGSPLIDGERPLHLGPHRTGGGYVARRLVGGARGGKREIARRPGCEPRRQKQNPFPGLRTGPSQRLASACWVSARAWPRTSGPARSAAGPDRHSA